MVSHSREPKEKIGSWSNDPQSLSPRGGSEVTPRPSFGVMFLLGPYGLRDYMGPSFEKSILVEPNFKEFRAKYFIPPSFQLSILDRESRVTLAIDRCVTTYKESLRAGLLFLFHLSINFFFDFYSILPARSLLT